MGIEISMEFGKLSTVWIATMDAGYSGEVELSDIMILIILCDFS